MGLPTSLFITVFKECDEGTGTAFVPRLRLCSRGLCRPVAIAAIQQMLVAPPLVAPPSSMSLPPLSLSFSLV